MPIYLIRKLDTFALLSDEDRQILQELASKPRYLGPRQNIIREGDNPEHLNVILEGWAFRYKCLKNGRRQIVALLLPGDLCDCHINGMRRMDHSIGTLTSVRLAKISRSRLEEITTRSPRIVQALNMDMLVASAIQREWTVNVGNRVALERLGHLFCEIFLRLRQIRLADGTSCALPLTQVEMADALGLTSVHINRTLHALRNMELVSLKNRQLTMLDLPGLQQASLFIPDYLHLGLCERQSRSADTENALAFA